MSNKDPINIVADQLLHQLLMDGWEWTRALNPQYMSLKKGEFQCDINPFDFSFDTLWSMQFNYGKFIARQEMENNDRS